uniref:Uncharacterized protein n=1 Tax=Myotis myotis TaxID=51298 RepID=A0A7J7QV83_MYOMY|nr:hypothetical protein mMyoMyo1_011551 [Myotis myotis]
MRETQTGVPAQPHTCHGHLPQCLAALPPLASSALALSVSPLSPLPSPLCPLPSPLSPLPSPLSPLSPLPGSLGLAGASINKEHFPEGVQSGGSVSWQRPWLMTTVSQQEPGGGGGRDAAGQEPWREQGRMGGQGRSPGGEGQGRDAGMHSLGRRPSSARKGESQATSGPRPVGVPRPLRAGGAG